MNDKQVAKNINASLNNSVALSLTQKFVVFTDLHYNREGGMNNSIEYLDLQRRVIFPHYLNNGFIGISTETFDLVEAKKYDNIWNYIPNRENIRMLGRLLDYDIPGNHNRKMYKIQHESLSSWHFVDAIRLLSPSREEIGLIIHGYQADRWNSGKKITSCVNWFVRNIWTKYEEMHQASKNVDLGNEVENYLQKYASIKGFVNQKPFILICGHTHNAKIIVGKDYAYVNAGCMVSPKAGHCVENDNGTIKLIRWSSCGERIVENEIQITA